MDRKELLYHIQKCEKQHERRKRKRFVYTVLFYAAVFMIIFYWQDQLGGNILEVLATLVLCVIFSCVVVLFNSVVFHQLFKLNQKETEAIEYLKKRLKEKENDQT